jgi:transcriptional regulator with XRE-family HTH domain
MAFVLLLTPFGGHARVERLAPIIRDLRSRLGLTQEEFAHALGITVSTVNRWEKGHSAPSKLARASLARFAGRRGVAVENLLDDTQSDPTPPRSESF